MKDEYIRQLFPEVEEIESKELRNKVVKIWVKAMEMGGWNKIDDIPFTLIIATDKSLVEHTRMIVKMAMAVADERKDLDRDAVIAGALLHDVGKLLEYERKDGKVVKSGMGKRIRHPVSGAALAMEEGLQDIAHIIAAHSKEGEFVERSKEAILIHHCDFIDFEIEKAKVKK
ncbi:MAG TPA: HDIG domain-containing protein [Thermoplasmatales archaeon]|nr:HDIG domain-containing protein [Thermoplasmatales archaeon]